MTLSFGGGAGVLTIPGLAGDGATPGGIVVDGAVTAGDSAANATPTLHTFYGEVYAQDTVGNDVASFPPLWAQQSAALAADTATSCATLYRSAALNGHDNTGSLLAIVDTSGSAGYLIEGLVGGVRKIGVNNVGGLGLFGALPPTAPRTLAQATITAITDASAKAAVQACANALADMGVLTLT